MFLRRNAFRVKIGAKFKIDQLCPQVRRPVPTAVQAAPDGHPRPQSSQIQDHQRDEESAEGVGLQEEPVRRGEQARPRSHFDLARVLSCAGPESCTLIDQ